MNFSDRLIRGTIVKNYQNLILDVKFKEGAIVPVFCSEMDYMPNLYVEGTEVWVSKNRDQRRKLRYECQILNRQEGLVMVNQNMVDTMFMEAFENGMISDLGDYEYIERVEGDYSVRNINFVLSNDEGKKCYVYLVSIYNKQGAYVVFPSTITFYEMEMFDELQKLREQGHDTAMVLIATRMDCLEAKFAWNINPIAAARIYDEAKKGLQFFCYGCNIDNKSISIRDKMKIIY